MEGSKSNTNTRKSNGTNPSETLEGKKVKPTGLRRKPNLSRLYQTDTFATRDANAKNRARKEAIAKNSRIRRGGSTGSTGPLRSSSNSDASSKGSASRTLRSRPSSAKSDASSKASSKGSSKGSGASRASKTKKTSTSSANRTSRLTLGSKVGSARRVNPPRKVGSELPGKTSTTVKKAPVNAESPEKVVPALNTTTSTVSSDSIPEPEKTDPKRKPTAKDAVQNSFKLGRRQSTLLNGSLLGLSPDLTSMIDEIGQDIDEVTDDVKEEIDLDPKFKSHYAPEEMRCLALVAHNHMKPPMRKFVLANKNLLCKFKLTGTNTTMTMLREVFGDNPDVKYGPTCTSGPLGGDAELVAVMCTENLGGCVFFQDPMSSHPHVSDIECLTRQANVHNVIMMPNPASAFAVMTTLRMALMEGRAELIPSFFETLMSPSVEEYKKEQKKILDSHIDELNDFS